MTFKPMPRFVLVQKPQPATDSWWTLKMDREQFDERAAREAERMNAVQSSQHIQRRENDK